MKKLIMAMVAGLVLALPLTAEAGGIQEDKAAHVGVSAVTEWMMIHNHPFDKWKPWQRALLNVVVVGGCKEWYDSRHSGHSAEWEDIAADAVGAFGTEGVVWLVHRTW